MYPRCHRTTRAHLIYRGCVRTWSPLGVNMFRFSKLSASTLRRALRSGIQVMAFLEYDTCDDENEYTMMMNSNHEELTRSFTTLVGIRKMRSTTKSKILSEGTKMVRDVLRRDHVDVLVIRNDMSLPTSDILDAAIQLLESKVSKMYGMFNWQLSRVIEIFRLCEQQQRQCPKVYVWCSSVTS